MSSLNRVYVIHENGQLLEDYGPKRVYLKHGHARNGIHQLKQFGHDVDALEIVEYAPVDDKWYLLKQYLMRMREENKYIPDYRWANGDALEMMDLLERGESLLE